jgi:hypothetical protein
VTITNTGNVRLNSVTISEGSCNPPSGLVDLNQTVTCTVEMASTQDHFEAGNMTLVVTVSAVSNSVNPSIVTVPHSATVALPVTRQLVLSMARSDNFTVVDKADTVVQMTVTASNGGNTHLHNVNLDVPDLENLACTNADGLVTLPADLLVGAGTIVCSGAFTFDQDALEGGSRNFSAGGSAADLGGPSAASNSVEVVVAASPGLQLDVDALNCTRAHACVSSTTYISEAIRLGIYMRTMLYHAHVHMHIRARSPCNVILRSLPSACTLLVCCLADANVFNAVCFLYVLQPAT